jgi:tetratricopeptide (TPR) repeat protein
MFKLFGKKKINEEPPADRDTTTNSQSLTPISSFKKLWVEGSFDHCDYYALTAPLDEWSADFPIHCISEDAGEVTEEGWGIVTWHLVVYVYSSQREAERRARKLGGNVKPLKLKCLSCFARVFSTFYSYVDLILDETWHMKSFVCRDVQEDLDYGRVGHVRLDSNDGLFQLEGCAGNQSLVWEPYRRYGHHKHPTEWCRPVPFPGSMVLFDHSAQGGYMDMDFLAPPESLDYLFFDENLWARDLVESRDTETIFSRPIGSLAFANLLGEKVRITRGEGVWIPIARGNAQEWHLFPWSQNLKEAINLFLQDPSQAQETNLDRGVKWYTNQALATLEATYLLDEDADDDSCAKARDEAVKLLDRATESAPWDWYAHTLRRDITRLDLNEIPALIHADRICWCITGGERASMDEEFAKAMSFRKDYELALYNYSMALRQIGAENDHIRVLEQLLEVDPQHSQGNFDMALLALQRGDEETEMQLYEISAESDPHFAPPLYNMGKTFEERGDHGKAVQYYLKALEVDPYYVEAIEQIGIIAHLAGKNDEAEKYFRRAVRADTWRIQTLHHIEQFAQNTGRDKFLTFIAQTFQYNMPRQFNQYLDQS